MGETQSKLLDLGEALIRQRGYDGFSYADISREAGIKKASIHYHFPTKQDLGLAVLDRYGERLLKRLGEISQTSRTGGQALTAVLDLYRPNADSEGLVCLCVALSGDTHAIGSNILEALRLNNSQVAEVIEAILIAGRRDRSISVSGDPAQEAMAILAQLQGAQLLARAAQDHQIFDQALSVLTARVSRH